MELARTVRDLTCKYCGGRRLLSPLDYEHKHDCTIPLDERLTPRQLEMSKLYASGEWNKKEIGHQLGVDEQTVKVTLDGAFQRLQIHNRLSLYKIIEGASNENVVK